MDDKITNWIEEDLANCVQILDSQRIPLNSEERSIRIDGKPNDELFPYYGATGQVGYIDNYIFDGEYLLIGEDGAPFFDKSKNVAYLVRGRFWVNNHAHILKANESITSNKYLLHYLNYFNYDGYVGGTTRLKLNQAKLKSIPVKLAPIDQQKQIVAKIEELFSHIDAGVVALQKAKQLLKQYRQSVLKAAVTGELTREWREQNKNKLEPASELLKRILSERRRKWEEQQLEHFKAQGKVPKDDKWKLKYIEPEAPVIQDVPELTTEWQYVRLDALTDIQGGITVDSKRSAEDTVRLPYLRVANVQRGFLDLSEIKEINVPKDRVESLSLKDRDILFNEGGDRDKLGRGWVWHEEVKNCTYQNHVFRARPYSSWIVSELVSIFGNTFGQEYFIRQGKQTTNLASINKTKLSAFPVPLCSEMEMKMAISLVDEKVRIIDRTAKNIESQLIAAEKNKQSILAAAFSGELKNTTNE